MIGKDIKAGKWYKCNDCMIRAKKGYVFHDGTRFVQDQWKGRHCYFKTSKIAPVKSKYLPSIEAQFSERIITNKMERNTTRGCTFNKNRRAFLKEISEREYNAIKTAVEV